MRLQDRRHEKGRCTAARFVLTILHSLGYYSLNIGLVISETTRRKALLYQLREGLGSDDIAPAVAAAMLDILGVDIGCFQTGLCKVHRRVVGRPQPIQSKRLIV